MVIEKTAVVLQCRNKQNLFNLYLFIMKTLEKIIDFINSLLYGSQKNVCDKSTKF